MIIIGAINLVVGPTTMLEVLRVPAELAPHFSRLLKQRDRGIEGDGERVRDRDREREREIKRDRELIKEIDSCSWGGRETFTSSTSSTHTWTPSPPTHLTLTYSTKDDTF